MNVPRAADDVGITTRQIDHWIRKDYIHAGLPGSGHPRNITGHEYQVLRCMAALVRAGVAASTAAPLARELANGRDVKFGPWWLHPVNPSYLTKYLNTTTTSTGDNA